VMAKVKPAPSAPPMRAATINRTVQQCAMASPLHRLLAGSRERPPFQLFYVAQRISSVRHDSHTAPERPQSDSSWNLSEWIVQLPVRAGRSRADAYRALIRQTCAPTTVRTRLGTQ
jgi:hypothetical protein